MRLIRKADNAIIKQKIVNLKQTLEEANSEAQDLSTIDDQLTETQILFKKVANIIQQAKQLINNIK